MSQLVVVGDEPPAVTYSVHKRRTMWQVQRAITRKIGQKIPSLTFIPFADYMKEKEDELLCSSCVGRRLLLLRLCWRRKVTDVSEVQICAWYSKSRPGQDQIGKGYGMNECLGFGLSRATLWRREFWTMRRLYVAIDGNWGAERTNFMHLVAGSGRTEVLEGKDWWMVGKTPFFGDNIFHHPLFVPPSGWWWCCRTE